MENKAYKAIMSSGENIQLDADEVQEAIEARANGDDYLARQGFINTSFLVSIVEDSERMDRFYEDKKFAEGLEYEKLRERGPEKLDDIFGDADAIDRIGSPNSN